MSVYHNLYETKISEITNDIKLNKTTNSYLLWSNYYSTVIKSFEWEGVPPFLKRTPFLIEEYLIYWGMCGAFEDSGEIKILPCYGSGALREDGLYTEYMFIAKNGKSYIRKIEDVELCFNNSNRIPSILSINEFTQKSSYALQVVDSALRKASLPNLLVADDETDLSSITDLYDEQGNLKPFRVTLNKGFTDGDIKNVSIFDNKNIDIKALLDVFKKYNDLFYNSFGVTTSIAKNERMSKEEALSNEEMVRYGLISDMLSCRECFVALVNEHFGTELSVKLNRAIEEYQPTDSTENEVIDND